MSEKVILTIWMSFLKMWMSGSAWCGTFWALFSISDVFIGNVLTTSRRLCEVCCCRRVFAGEEDYTFWVNFQEHSVSRLWSIFVAAFFLCTSTVFAQEPDANGCKDHALFTRFPGFRIQRCDVLDFGSHSFRLGAKEVKVEGRRTEIMYYLNEGAKAPGAVALHRNFENAIKKIGGALVGDSGDGDRHYKIVRADVEIWVDVGANINEQYLLQIVEKSAMKQEIEADAATLGAGIKAEGRIAVYGIHFDTGKAEIKPDSEPALNEIAKLLKTQPALKLHVVGHTDNVASLDSNLRLSRARAEAVVAALSGRYSISGVRLVPNGVGPLAPMANNDSEAGRAQNRRVELVKQ
jgi:OOP family OmpA-OmpF porin